jgi:hypothetical protein
MGAGRVAADPVAVDLVPGGADPADLDAVLQVARDHVAFAGQRAADRVVRVPLSRMPLSVGRAAVPLESVPTKLPMILFPFAPLMTAMPVVVGVPETQVAGREGRAADDRVRAVVEHDPLPSPSARLPAAVVQMKLPRIVLPVAGLKT